MSQLPLPPGERAEDELTGPTAGAAMTDAFARAFGRPYHVNCGLRCDREADRFRCPEHGLVEWNETRYGAASEER